MHRDWFAAVLVIAALPAGSLAAAPALEVLEGSQLGFTAVQAGAAFSGRFEGFEAAIDFDPDDLENSSFVVRVDMASVATGHRERDDILRGEEFFAVAGFPRATFRAGEFLSEGGGRFIALGSLQIRDVEKPLRLPFEFRSPDDAGAPGLLSGSVEIDRMDFGVGRGEWRDPKWIAHKVVVKFSLVLGALPVLDPDGQGA